MVPVIFVIHAISSLLFSMMFFMSVPTPNIPIIGPLMDLRTLEEMEGYAGIMWFCALIGVAAAFLNPGFFHLVYAASRYALAPHNWGYLFFVFLWAVMFTTEVGYLVGAVVFVSLGLDAPCFTTRRKPDYPDML